MALEEALTERSTLPPAEGFAGAFRDWHKELRGKGDSSRAKKQANEPYEVGTFPKHTSKHNYEIGEQPWKKIPPTNNNSLLDSELYRSTREPAIKIQPPKLRTLEAELREAISILSHMDWFVAAAKKEAHNQGTALEDRDLSQEGNDVVEEKKPLLDRIFDQDQNLWNGLSNIEEILESVGRGIQDTTKIIIHMIGLCTLTRRDAFLLQMNDISKETTLDLRTGDINGDKLFDEEALKKAKEELTAKRNRKAQDSLLRGKPAQGEHRNRSREVERSQKPRPFRRNSDNSSGLGSQFQNKPGAQRNGGKNARGRGRGKFARK
jgi:hypothetical protein